MKPLFVLIISFVFLLLIGKYTNNDQNIIVAGNLAMSIMLLFTAMGHFKFKKSMAAMIPIFIPKKIEIVILTGVLEILFAIGIGMENTRHYSGIGLIIFLLCILPANIYSAKHRVDYEDLYKIGPGIKYLWFRVPFQLFLIGWVWYFSVK